MKTKLPEVLYLYELALSIDIKSMRALRSRSTEWFSRDLVWYDDDHYGDQEEEIDATDDDGKQWLMKKALLEAVSWHLVSWPQSRFLEPLFCQRPSISRSLVCQHSVKDL